MKTALLYNPAPPNLSNIRRYSFAPKTWRHLLDYGVIECPVSVDELHRNSKEVGDSKELPFIKDMIEKCYEKTNAEFIILINSDICFHKDIARRIDEKINSSGLCFSKKRNFGIIDSEIDDINSGFLHKHGYDFFAFPYEWYLKIKDSFPDYLLGYFRWDMTMSDLMYIYNPTSEVENIIYHEHHEYPPEIFYEPGMIYNMNISPEKYSRARIARCTIAYLRGENVHDDVRHEMINLNKLGIPNYEIFKL